MRQYQLDNAKFALIVLVVLGHLLEQIKGGSVAMETAYRFLYLFHIPAFAYLSGVVCPSTFDAKAGKRWLATLLIPYLVFQGVYLFIAAEMTGRAFVYQATHPHWIMWYLLSLATWRLLLPVVLAVRWPIAFAVSVALVAGLMPDVGYGLSLSRTFVFLPFFVAGHILGGRVSGSRVSAVFALAGLLAVAHLIRGWSPHWLFGGIGYRALKTDWVQGMVTRATLLLAGGIGCWAILRLMPERDGAMAEAGRSSLSVYLLHGIVLKALTAWGAFSVLARWPWAIVGIAPASVFAIAWLGRPLRPLMDYRWAWNLGSALRLPSLPSGEGR